MQQNIKKTQSTSIIVLILVLVILGVTWTLSKPSSNSVPKLFSLKEKWDSMESIAHNWQKDAYLTNVTFYVTGQLLDPSAAKIVAEYHSSNMPDDNMFFVKIDNSGNATAFPFDMAQGASGLSDTGSITVSAGSSATNPLHREEWTIDSQDALNIFAQNKTISSCFRSSEAVIELSLNKTWTESPAWELTIFNCPDKSFASYYLNAQTGEVIAKPRQ